MYEKDAEDSEGCKEQDEDVEGKWGEEQKVNKWRIENEGSKLKKTGYERMRMEKKITKIILKKSKGENVLGRERDRWRNINIRTQLLNREKRKIKKNKEKEETSKKRNSSRTRRKRGHTIKTVMRRSGRGKED